MFFDIADGIGRCVTGPKRIPHKAFIQQREAMPNDDDSVDAKVLAAQGQERLATLLVEVAMTNACMHRRLRLEVSAQNDEPGIDVAVRRWIDEFREQTSFFDAKQIG